MGRGGNIKTLLKLKSTIPKEKVVTVFQLQTEQDCIAQHNTYTNGDTNAHCAIGKTHEQTTVL